MLVDRNFVTVEDLLRFVKENDIPKNSEIWIDFGSGDGTFVRKKIDNNVKTSEGVTYEDNKLRLNLSTNSLGWERLNAIHPVNISNCL